jgi:4-amino-4-deoxy-L-arabinose transferase-like glycosyltransferase
MATRNGVPFLNRKRTIQEPSGLSAEQVTGDSFIAAHQIESTATSWTTGTALVVWIAVGTVLIHLATGSRYGFDRDELMALEDARHLAWGYVQYPPMTAFFGRVSLAMFGTSLVGFRFFAAVAQAAAVVLTGLMAKAMGGKKWAQVTAALAAVPFCLGGGSLMQYISFDYLCWVLVAYCVVRVAAEAREQDAKTVTILRGEPWWIGVGLGMGLGMMSKYTMAFFVLGVVAGIALTSMRAYLRSAWLWLGVALSWFIFLPNLLWQWRRNFISIEFLKFLHVRDVGEGLTDWFLPGQMELTLLALPLAIAGLWFFFFTEEGKRFRILGWMYVVPLFLFLMLRGRDYYLAPAYPMLYAAGAVWVERKFKFACEKGSTRNSANWLRRVLWACLLLDVAVAALVALPIAPVNSPWWKFAASVDTVLPEEIGWPEFVEAVAAVRDRLPPAERDRAGILAGNYGEVGALNLYGEKHGLPKAISGVNSSWERGYGDPPPDTLIVVGYSREFLEGEFSSCQVGGRVWNHYGILNEETTEDPEIFVCRGLKEPWPQFWPKARRFA